MGQRVHIQQEFEVPVERAYAYLAEHENLSTVFGLKVERVKDGDTERNGVGSVRRLSIGGVAPFEETVTQTIPNELIEYRITKGGPLRNHLGTMRFSALPNDRSSLDYTIVFGAAVPLLASIVKRGLQSGLKRGLPKVNSYA